MATYTLSPVAKQQFLDNSGNPLANGRIYTFEAGTSTPLSTYRTSSGTAWGAYIQLDSAGRPETGSIYLQPGQSYKYEARTSAGVTLWTQDNIAAVPTSASSLDVTGTAGEALTAGDLVYMSSAVTWLKCDADAALSSVAASLVGIVPDSIASGSTGTIRLAGSVTVPGPLSPGSDYFASATAGAITATPPTNAIRVGRADSSSSIILFFTKAPVSPVSAPKGRLTLTTGVPVTTGDVTAATTIYYAPYQGNVIDLFNGTSWATYPLTQLSIAVPATTNQMYDVFVDYNAGVPALSVTAWTNDTTRATALTTQDGAYVLTGALTKRYVGSFRTTAVSGQTEDSLTKRLLYNYYHRVERPLRRVETDDTWTYTTATIRQAGGNTANQVEIVNGVAEEALNLSLRVGSLNAASVGNLDQIAGIGEDSTSTFTVAATNTNDYLVSLYVQLVKIPAVGYHFYSWNEWSTASGTTSWWSTNPTGGTVAPMSGLNGMVRQ